MVCEGALARPFTHNARRLAPRVPPLIPNSQFLIPFSQLPITIHFDYQPPPARDLVALDALHLCAGAPAAEHPGGEPPGDRAGQVADYIAAGRVDPHEWIVRTWRIRYKDEAVAGVEAVNYVHSLAEHRSVDGCSKVRIIRRGHGCVHRYGIEGGRLLIIVVQGRESGNHCALPVCRQYAEFESLPERGGGECRDGASTASSFG